MSYLKIHLNKRYLLSMLFLLSFINITYSQIPYIKVDENNNINNENPDIAVNPNNQEFLIFWQIFSSDTSWDVYGKKYDKNGKSKSETIRINDLMTNGDQSNPRVGFLNSQKLLVVWHCFYNTNYMIQGRIIDSNLQKINSEFQIDSPNDKNHKTFPSIFLLSNERFIVFYQYQKSDKIDIYATIYDSNQNMLKGNFKINLRSIGWRIPSCGEFSDNRFVIVYSSYNESYTDLDIYAKIYDSKYNIVNNEIKINTYSVSTQNFPLVSIGPNDEILIAYESFIYNQWDILYKIYNKDFSENKTNESTVNYYTKGLQGITFSRKIEDNKVVICWRGDCDGCSIYDISCRTLDFQGNFINKDFRISKENFARREYVRFSNLNNQQLIYAFPFTNYSGWKGTHIYLTFYNLSPRVNSVINYEQTKPLTIAMNNGGFMIIWLCEKCSGLSNKFQYKIYDQTGIISVDGIDIDTVDLSNTQITNDISGISFNGNNIFLVWDSYSSSNVSNIIYGKILNMQGIILKDKFQIASSSTVNRKAPKIATDQTGIILVIWNDFDIQTNRNTVSGKFYNDSGNFVTNKNDFITNNIQQISNMCGIGNGKFLVLYDSMNGFNLTMVYGMTIETSVTYVFTSSQINSDTSTHYYNAGCSLTRDNNRIVIIFTGNNQVYFKIYSNDTSYTQLLDQTIIDYSDSQKLNPNLINLKSGGFVVGWEEKDRDGSGLGVFYKRFDSYGIKYFETRKANSFTYLDQKQISFSELTDGRIVVAYSSFGDGDGNGIYYDFIINCPINSFIDPLKSESCSLCNSSCSSCQDTAKNCTRCKTGYYKLEPNQNTCVNTQIPNNYLQIPIPSDGYYLKCADMCASCVNTINNCQTCKSSTAKLVEISRGIKNCFEDTTGYYLPSGSSYYKKCSSYCKTCIETNTNCTSCESSLKLAQINSSLYECIQDTSEYFNYNSLYYIKCALGCKSCTSLTNCLICNTNFYLVENYSKERLCIDNLKGYYSTTGGIYQKCSSECETCQNLYNNCITCENPKQLAESSKNSSNKKCINDFKGYYLDSISLYYKLCSSNCKTCEYSENNCRSCFDGFNLALISSNLFECRNDISNYFLVSDQNYYQKCDEICAKCEVSATKCLTCNTNKNYYPIIYIPNKCILSSSIQDGYFFSISTNTFEKCDDSCATCLDSKEYCTTCKISDGYNKLSDKPNSCKKSCPEEYLQNPSNNVCQKCNVNCKTCFIQTDNCKSCFENYSRIEVSTNKFECRLNTDGYYFNSDLKYFKKCGDSCLKCKEKEDICLTCNNKGDYYPKVDEKTKCILKSKSPDGYFFDEKTSIHQICDISCKICNGNSRHCISCNNEKYYLYKLEDNLNSCVFNCPDGYNNIPENQICKLCSKVCKTCESDIDNCKTCAIGLFLTELEKNKNTCFDNIEGYYLDQANAIFRKCSQGCKKCLDSNNCIICDNDSGYLSMQQNNISNRTETTCAKECPNFYVKKNDNKSCINNYIF